MGDAPDQNRDRKRAAAQDRDRKRSAKAMSEPAEKPLANGRDCGHGPLADGRGSDSSAPLADGRGSDSSAPLANGRGSESGPEPASDGTCGSIPLACLITFRTYGSWLHGDARGSVDREHNVYATPLLGADPRRESAETQRLKHAPVTVGAQQRAVVRQTIVDVCEHRDWWLHELDVRTNHVHLAVSAPVSPERVMRSLKSWSTRRLKEAGLIAPGTQLWSRHGSTRYLWNAEQLRAACQYVLDGQGGDLL